ncbi:hypothetical protein [Parapedobacter sp. DT-150]|uniref:hypothetical protein n=1 Tax=Parapedobacter sp. DT-150 TaxID=3396162 RepID=UPI003F194B1F
MKVFYYYYYRFYSKVLVQSEPHFVVILVLSAMEGFLINYLIDFLIVHLCCTIPSEIWYKLLVVGVLLIANFNYYGRKGKGTAIVKEKPKFFDNHRVSIIIVLVITLSIISLLFWAADYKMVVLADCK